MAKVTQSDLENRVLAPSWVANRADLLPYRRLGQRVWRQLIHALVHTPLLWTDKLVATQFVWLAMLGAVIAFCRAEHIRTTTFIRNVSLPWRRYFEALALAVVLFGPLMFLVACQVSVEAVHYAMVVILGIGIGLFAPAFGVGYYAAWATRQGAPRYGGVAHRPLHRVAALILGLLVVIFMPAISAGFL